MQTAREEANLRAAGQDRGAASGVISNVGCEEAGRSIGFAAAEPLPCDYREAQEYKQGDQCLRRRLDRYSDKGGERRGASVCLSACMSWGPYPLGRMLMIQRDFYNFVARATQVSDFLELWRGRIRNPQGYKRL